MKHIFCFVNIIFVVHCLCAFFSVQLIFVGMLIVIIVVLFATQLIHFFLLLLFHTLTAGAHQNFPLNIKVCFVSTIIFSLLLLCRVLLCVHSNTHNIKASKFLTPAQKQRTKRLWINNKTISCYLPYR